LTIKRLHRSFRPAVGTARRRTSWDGVHLQGVRPSDPQPGLPL